MDLNKTNRDKLATRTVQIIGFGTFAVLLTLKIFGQAFKVELDIPWWVIFGFFGFGASADLEFIRIFSGPKK